MDVSRETRRAVFGDRLPLAEAYADLLTGPGVVRGLVGPREADRIWSRHLVNSAVAAPAFPDEGTVLDIGAGAGLPGIPLAIVRPGLRVRLVEPLLRRTTFLAEVVADLGLDNVEVVRGRAEDLHGSVRVPVVTGRAVAPLERLAGWCLPLLVDGGALLALKGERAAQELAGAEPLLRRYGCRRWAVEEHGAGLVDPPVRVVRVVAGPVRGQPGPTRPTR